MAGAVEEQGPTRRWCGGGDGRPGQTRQRVVADDGAARETTKE
jgi:hypothetical protein